MSAWLKYSCRPTSLSLLWLLQRTPSWRKIARYVNYTICRLFQGQQLCLIYSRECKLPLRLTIVERHSRVAPSGSCALKLACALVMLYSSMLSSEKLLNPDLSLPAIFVIAMAGWLCTRLYLCLCVINFRKHAMSKASLCIFTKFTADISYILPWKWPNVCYRSHMRWLKNEWPDLCNFTRAISKAA